MCDFYIQNHYSGWQMYLMIGLNMRDSGRWGCLRVIFWNKLILMVEMVLYLLPASPNATQCVYQVIQKHRSTYLYFASLLPQAISPPTHPPLAPPAYFYQLMQNTTARQQGCRSHIIPIVLSLPWLPRNLASHANDLILSLDKSSDQWSKVFTIRAPIFDRVHVTDLSGPSSLSSF